MAHHSLVALAETAKDVGAALDKFSTPVADASAEIAALVASCFSTSAALLRLDETIQDYEYDPRYTRIRPDIGLVRESLVYTFDDVKRLFGFGLARADILPGPEYRRLWRNLTTHFEEQGEITLERRLITYHEFLKDLDRILTDGRPRNGDVFRNLRHRIDALLQAQVDSRIVDDFDRLAIDRPPSFERVRPRRPPTPEARRRHTRPQPPMDYDYEDRYPWPQRPRRRSPRPRSPVDYEDRYDLPLDLGRRSPRPRSPLAYEYDPRPRKPGRRRRDRWRMDADYYGRDQWAPAAPDVPGSPTETFSSLSSGTRSMHEHWLPAVFDQAQPPSTLLNSTGQTSVALGEDNPNARHQLATQGYDKLIELSFDNGDLAVRFYHRHNDGRSRMLCRTLRPSRSYKESCELLTALAVERRGPCLEFIRRNRRGDWAVLKFLSYETLVLFFCTFLALRAEDSVTPITSIDDAVLDGEHELFAGRIIDDHYEHALRVFQDIRCRGIRLEASVLRGNLDRTPVWTAFITHQVLSPRWMTRASSRVIHLADLKRYIFTNEYTPQTAIDGQHELNFVYAVDARGFRDMIYELAEVEAEEIRR